MKKLFYALLLLALCLSFTHNAAAQFTTGNITVLQVGDGAAALTSAGTPLFLKEYNTTTPSQTTPVTTVTIPVSGAARLVQSGTATSEGQITLSQDSTKIVISGYDTTIGVTGVASTTSANIARAIDTVGNAGVAGKADTTKTAFSGNNIRSAARSSAENYWAVGGTTGVYYMGNTATPAVVYSTATNFRVINAANNKLYFSSASGLSRIMRINSQPAGTAVTADTMIVLGTGTTPSPYGFAVNAAETIVYVADDRTTGLGGIQKWVGSGTTWTLAYTLPVGTASGARGIAVDWSGINPVIYATANTSATAGGNLIKIVDSNSTATFVVLTTAPANTAFRSVVFSPRAACITPVLSATVTNYTCAGNGAITLAVTSGSTPVSYSYTGPNGFTAATQNISNLQSGTYVVTATTTGGCVATQTYVVANNSTAVSATITPAAATICQGQSVTLSAPTGTGYTYVWKLNGAVVTGNTTNSLVATAAGTYRVIVSSGVNCTDSSSAVVTVNPLPAGSIAIGGGSNAYCAGAGNQLCFTPAGSFQTYQWQLNGTNIVGANGVCYTPTATGNYCVVVTNANPGCSATFCQAITINALPSAVVTANGPTTFCQGDSVKLTAPLVAANTYVWKLNGTVIAGATANTYTATAAGSYRVVVTNASGCKDSSATTTVTVNPLPNAVIAAAGPTTFCNGGSVQLCVNNPSPNTTYQWRLNGVNIAANTNCITATLSGTYCVTVVNTTTGCMATSCTPVTVGAPPAATITPAGPLAICQGSSIVLHTNNSPGLTYQWYNGTTPITTNGNDSTYTVTAAGSYTVKVSLSSTCFSTSSPVAVTVNPVPAATLTPSAAQSICVGQSITFTANTGTGLTYQFTGQTAAGNNPAYIYQGTAAGTVTVAVTVTNGNGCTATSAPAVITVNAKPVAAFTTSADTVCQMSTIVFTAPAGTGNTYQWYEATIGALPGQMNNILNLTSPAAATNSVFTIRLVVTNAAGCSDTTAYKTVVFRPLPVPVISYNNGVLSTFVTYAGWQWMLNGNPVPGATLQLFTPTANGSYNVLVTDAFGCSDTALLAVNVTGLSVHQTPGITGIKVYPNPATDIVHIDAPFAVNIVLRDMQGRIVLRKNAAKLLDISALTDGVYQLTATDAAGHYLETIRVMKTAK